MKYKDMNTKQWVMAWNEEAELLDRVDTFGSYHTKVELPENTDTQSEINTFVALAS